MKVLITGGAGFLGRRFVQHHAEAGDEVWAIDDFTSAGAHWPGGAAFGAFEGDMAFFLKKGWAEDTDWDLAYHFAAPVGGRVKIEGDPMYNAGSLAIDADFFRWATGRPGRVKTVVYPSSSAVYPVSLQSEGERAMQLQEGMFSAAYPNWEAPDEMYGFTKLVGERLAWTAAKYGVNTLCIRPFSGYGEGQSFDYPVPSIARRALNREDPLVVWGDGRQTRDFVHVDDIVGATVARLEAGVEGYQTMNIGYGFPISFIAVARSCAELVGYNPRIVTDTTKPVGVTNRWADTQRMRKYYPQPLISIGPGLVRVLKSLEP